MTVSVQIATAVDGLPDVQSIERWAHAALAGAERAVCLRIIDESEARELNLTYRNLSYAPNVLSFPFSADDGSWPEGMTPMLGDVVICAPVVASQANDQGKTLRAHMAHMVVHGILHLCGFDHQNDEDAMRMERREAEVLASFDVEDPYLI